MKIVIVGGGFCGSYCARKLEKKFDVTLIDSKDYFEFTPSIPHVVCDIEHRDKIRVKHKDYLKRANVIVDNVKKIDKGHIKLGNETIEYDYLIVSLPSFICPLSIFFTL